MSEVTPKGRYSRGYIPHIDWGKTTQFITYRLADSLPQNVLENFRLQIEREEITEKQFLVWVEEYLDSGIGECWLGRKEIAEIVEQNLLRFDGVKYKLHAWVIMPNHVHSLLTSLEGYSLEEITHSCKSYTATKANKMLGRAGPFWFPESFDRFIRDEAHFDRTFRYIENNPVKAGFCKKPQDWRFSSAWHRAQHR